MDLRTYLFIRKMKMTTFARMVGYSHSHIHKIVHKQRLPSLRLAQLIEEKTAGEITISDLMEIGNG